MFYVRAPVRADVLFTFTKVLWWKTQYCSCNFFHQPFFCRVKPTSMDQECPQECSEAGDESSQIILLTAFLFIILACVRLYWPPQLATEGVSPRSELSRLRPITARRLIPLHGFKSSFGHVIELPVTWVSYFSLEYSIFPHYWQLVSHDLIFIRQW